MISIQNRSTQIKSKSNTIMNMIMISLLLIIPIIIFVTGGTKNVFVHLMYIPIIIAARKRNILVVLFVTIISGLIVGPLMPDDTHLQTAQSLQKWIFRTSMFIFVGTVVYFLNNRVRKDLYINKLILSSINEGVLVVDDSFRIAYVNDLFCEMNDISTDNVINRDIFEFLYNEFRVLSSTIQYSQLVKAIKNSETVTKILLPVKLNQHGEIISEYDVKSLKGSKIKGCAIIVRNIQSQISYERNLVKLSYTDPLTGINNRRSYEKKVNELVGGTVLPMGLILVDVDGMKFINDSFGRHQGDEVIIRLASILREIVKGKGFTARLDGDGFIAVVYNSNANELDSICDMIKEEVGSFRINSLTVGVSCGYSICESLDDVDQSFEKAENDMYIDKNSSENSMRNNPIDTIIHTLHEKDLYSEQHSKEVSKISTNIAKAMKLPGNMVKEISQAALLHDIGKIIVPINILTKDGPLTDSEYSKMKEHSSIGYRLLSGMKNLNNIPEYVLHHHERWDGKGYPNKIKEENIPLGSRIISVADSYNAMTTNRSYRQKISNKEALDEIINCAGKQFDPDVIKVFTKHFEEII